MFRCVRKTRRIVRGDPRTGLKDRWAREMSQTARGVHKAGAMIRCVWMIRPGPPSWRLPTGMRENSSIWSRRFFLRTTSPESISAADIERVIQSGVAVRHGAEDHFDWISALHKSLRGSDPHAGLYWLARMLEAGEDPKFIVRRLIVFASEDVGLADPAALVYATAAMQAVGFVGMPECRLALAQLVLYLALAPKSNSAYASYGRAQEQVRGRGRCRYR